MPITVEKADEFIRDGITPAEAARAVGVSPKSVVRWMQVGIIAEGGRVKLSGGRRGGRLVTTMQAVREFIAATSALPGDEETSSGAMLRSPAERRRAIEAADARNDRRQPATSKA